MSETQVAETGDTSLREDLAKQFDAEVAQTEDAPEELKPAPELTAGEEDPVVESKEQPTEPEYEPAQEPVVEDKAVEQEPPEIEEAEAEGEEKAPASWSPTEREEWKELTSKAKAAIKRREKEHDSLLQENASSRQTYDAFNEISNQYASQIAAEGATPLSAYKGFMEMAATLQSSNQQAKAELITRFMKNYGVDVTMVDDLLVKGQIQTPEGSQAPEWAKPIIQDFSTRQQQQYEDRTQANKSLVSETEAFIASKEFGKDVRAQMSAVFTMASNNPGAGTPTLEEAYTEACQMNPEVRNIIVGRENAKKIEEAKKASSSVTDASIGINKNSVPGDDLDLRAQLNKAWEQHL